jgi:hypothetical protein
MGPSLGGIVRQDDRRAEQRASKGNDTHSKHDACSDFVFGRRERRRFKPVRARRGAPM